MGGVFNGYGVEAIQILQRATARSALNISMVFDGVKPVRTRNHKVMMDNSHHPLDVAANW